MVIVRTVATVVLALAALRAAGGQTPAVLAFTGATLIDGTGRPPVAGATIVVHEGRVVAAGPSGQVSIPAGAERIALDGKVVIPGLISAHVHVSDSARTLHTYAAYGITTVQSLGDEPPEVFAARAVQATPSLDRTRVFVAGPVLASSSPAEARSDVDALAPRHPDFVKIRVDDNLGTTPKMTPEVYRAVISEAHRLGLRAATHLFYLADARALVAAGTDFIAHSIRDSVVDDTFVAALKRSGACYTPTLMREVSTYVYGTRPAFFVDPTFLAHANRAWIDTLSDPARMEATRTSSAAARYRTALDVAKQNLKKLSDAGIPIAMGTDTGPMGRFQGYFELLELEQMVSAGLTPRQALAAATRDAARCLRLDRDLGTLEPGKWADFVVLDASPLDDIANVRRISSVWIAGNRVVR